MERMKEFIIAAHISIIIGAVAAAAQRMWAIFVFLIGTLAMTVVLVLRGKWRE